MGTMMKTLAQQGMAKPPPLKVTLLPLNQMAAMAVAGKPQQQGSAAVQFETFDDIRIATCEMERLGFLEVQSRRGLAPVLCAGLLTQLQWGHSSGPCSD